MKSADVLCNGCGGEVLNVSGRPRMLAQKNCGGGGGGGRENSKTLFCEVCRLGSVKNLTTSPC